MLGRYYCVENSRTCQVVCSDSISVVAEDGERGVPTGHRKLSGVMDMSTVLTEVVSHV